MSESENNEIKNFVGSNYKKEELITNLDKNNSIESLRANRVTLNTNMRCRII